VVLCLSPKQLQIIQQHAEQTYPEECCGFLLGKFNNLAGAFHKTVMQVWQTPNTWTPEIQEMGDRPSTSDRILSKHNRYWIDPQDTFAAQKYARAQQFDIIGIYHSHTDHPAIPSECDRTLAWSRYSYLIVSVQQGIAQDLLSWNLDSNHQFQPEPIDLINPPD
jgi:proteasome lid subunit RPN8/RPN11